MKCALLLLCSLTASAADPALTGPLSGFLLDGRSGAIRAVTGFPGGAQLGADLPLPFQISRAAFFAGSDFAAVVNANDATVYLIRGMRTRIPQVVPLQDAIFEPDLLTMNDAGTALALYSKSRAQGQIISGLPNAPRASTPIDLGPISGAVTSIAVDGSGTRLLVGARSESNGSIYSVTPANPSPQFLSAAGNLVAIRFVNSDRDALVLDNLQNQLILVADWNGTPNTILLATDADGINGPVGLQRLTSGEVAVTNAGAKTISVVSLSPPVSISQINVEWPLTRCERLGDGSAIALNEPGPSPLLLLDPNHREAVYFVPAQ